MASVFTFPEALTEEDMLNERAANGLETVWVRRLAVLEARRKGASSGDCMVVISLVW